VVTVASFVLLFGLFLLIAAFVMFLLGSGARRAHRTIAGTVPAPLDTWRSGPVAANAVTDYGPGGPQTGPVSGEQCTWYRVEVVRSPSRTSDDRTGQDVLGHLMSGSPALADESGRVVVDPRVLVRALGSGHPVGTERSGTFAGARFANAVPDYARAMVGKLRSYEEIHLVELRLPRGRKVFVAGSVRAGGRGPAVLTPNRGDATVFTTDSRDQVLDGLAKTGSAGAMLLRWFGVAGLVATIGSAVLLYLVG
jgi:hypothetical protein